MHSRTSPGFGIVELMLVVAIIGIVASMATPALLRARSSANEASAIASIRAITSAQRAYAVTCGDGLYAPSLAALGTAADGARTGFLSPDLARPEPVSKSGYQFSLTGERTATPPDDMNCADPAGGVAAGDLLVGYIVTASAESGFTGARNFWTNTDSNLFELPQTSSFNSRNVIGIPELDPDANAVQGGEVRRTIKTGAPVRPR